MPKALRMVQPLVNHVTGQSYTLVPVADVRIDDATVDRIVSICNEPEVYQWLFRDLLQGRPYAQESARQWIQWSTQGWVDGTHFVFAAVDAAGSIGAACDIKSADPIAEIGYWCSRRDRGIMTNAVAAMCRLARESGFLGCYARTKHGNARSQAVLERCGFKPSSLREKEFDRFELSWR